MPRDEFSVAQWYPDERGAPGKWEYVCRDVSLKEAMWTFRKRIASGAAARGDIVKVIVTDGGDYTTAKWELGKGIDRR